MIKNRQNIYIFILLILCASARSQRINGFNLTPLDNGINVNFNIAAGPDCYGYKIFHCLDSLSYLEIYDFAGICGTSGSNEFKSFTHTSPAVNQINYYKIQLYPYEVAYKSILYGSGAKGTLLAFPNPVSTYNSIINLRAVGLNNEHVEGYICTSFGVKKQQINGSTTGDLLEISISGFEDGVYFVWLSEGSRVYSTKFIVLNIY